MLFYWSVWKRVFFFWVESGSSFKRSADTVKKNWTRILYGLKKAVLTKFTTKRKVLFGEACAPNLSTNF